MLVQMSGIHRIPAIKLRYGSKMHEPIHLNCLPESPWSMCRDKAANLCYLFQFNCPLKSRRFSHLFSQIRMAFSKKYRSIA